jgi:Zn-dependent protease with chaperone function
MAYAIAEHQALLAELAQPSPTYKRRVWTAVAGLAVFVLLYFVLAGWLLLTAHRLTLGAEQSTFVGFLVGGSALFLAVFMLKAVFAVKRGGTQRSIEITAAEEPRLFAFLNELADNAGAPRPHRVYLSAHVNAGVFYDLSALNLVFPSKKNLEIGLGLVNGLTLGELHAVLAHEFGHFSQSAMAVGRWTYVAQQIAADLVTRRDKLDEFLERLARIDLRVAWIGWILKVVVWSIRSLVDSAFHLVVLTQRALSRQMEFHADLVAVCLTGSDALMHALRRLQSADDSWNRTLGFVSAQVGSGSVPRDIFAIQSRLMDRMGEILNDPDYAKVPAIPIDKAAEHRLFKPELAQPPQMWLTHPLNHERETNAKQRYVSAPIDERSAWSIFDNAQAARERVTAALLQVQGKEPVAIEQTLGALNDEFARDFLASRYRGIYLARSVTRGARTPDDLLDAAPDNWRDELDQLYPASLTDDVGHHRRLETELAQLRALQSGALKPSEGVIRHRGRTLKSMDLTTLIGEVERESALIEDKLRAVDRRCRSVHLAAARHLSRGWEAYLRGVLDVLHYAEHTEANLRDLQGMLSNTLAVAVVTGRVSSAGRQRVIEAANALRRALSDVFAQANEVHLAPKLLERLGNAASWQASIGTFDLPHATEENIGEWLKVIDGWVGHAAGSCSALASAALDHLLATETLVARHAKENLSLEQAPPAPRVPPRYDALLKGEERKRQTTLGWWERFQVADGIIPSAARIAVAATIVIAVLGFGETVGQATITLHNGLHRNVHVTVNGQEINLPPSASQAVELEAGDYRIRTRTSEGRLVEEIEAAIPGSFAKFVYNVAGASPLVQWTAVYGNAQPRPPVMLGAPVWIRTTAEYVLERPPESMSSRTGGAIALAVSAWGETPGEQLSMLKSDQDRNRVIEAHARWDRVDAKHTETWLRLAHRFFPNFTDILAERLRDTPSDIVLLRLEQDAADSNLKAAVCARHTARAGTAPDNPDWSYLATRCIADSASRQRGFLAGYRKWPTSGWYSYAMARTYLDNAQWKEAFNALEQVRRMLPSQREDAIVDLARVYRVLHADNATAPGAQLQALVRSDTSNPIVTFARQSDRLRLLLEAETRPGTIGDAGTAYAELAQGNLDRALAIAAADAEVEARVIRLSAASDGATSEISMRARALEAASGIDSDTWWTHVALTARNSGDVGSALKVLEVPPEYTKPLQRFIDLVRAGKLANAERQLDGFTPFARGQGYAVGVVLLGDKAPPAWRRQAKRLLFASERPYFR